MIVLGNSFCGNSISGPDGEIKSTEKIFPSFIAAPSSRVPIRYACTDWSDIPYYHPHLFVSEEKTKPS